MRVRLPEATPNPENATPDELVVAMEAAPNKRSYIRLAAVRALLLGTPRPHRLQTLLPHRAHGPPLD